MSNLPRFSKAAHIIWATVVVSIGCLLLALYMQVFRDVPPCPLCVMQRYAYCAVALFGIVAILSGMTRLCSALALVFSLGGLGTAVYQLWLVAHPAIQCGRDPLEAAVNSLFPARWFPLVFQSDGFCNEAVEALFGLTPPQWSVLWFFVFCLAFVFICLKKRT